VYRKLERFDLAGQRYQQALTIFEKSLGPIHPTVATGVRKLAMLHAVQGHWEQAASLARRAFAIREKSLYPGHPDIALMREFIERVRARDFPQAGTRP
jgi:tetratricopeptide (TPR) repeat protein